jgi:hypothetical protein
MPSIKMPPRETKSRAAVATRATTAAAADAAAAAAVAVGKAAMAAVLSSHELLCAIFALGAAAGIPLTASRTRDVSRVCRAWARASASVGLWRAALARRFPAALADAAFAAGAPPDEAAEEEEERRARRAFLRRARAEAPGYSSSFLRAPPAESALRVLAREYRFCLDVLDAAGASLLSATFHFGASSPWHAVPLVRSCNVAARLALHGAPPGATRLRALAGAGAGAGVRAWLTAQRHAADGGWASASALGPGPRRV